MSEPKLISPLLDNYIMGDPISDHHGVRCCPAMAKDSDDKYIVKIISIPPSQSKIDALLLSGAYANVEACEAYFKDLVRELVTEIETLQKLSAQEGFLACDDYQVVPMDNGTGFDVYLLTKYRRSFARQSARSAVTHREALNLALDMCSALSACRRSGYLFADLKPDNIYLTESGEYRIGDLGFLNLMSLKYASLPEKYLSAYTAPEITDAYSSINTTLDIYALGTILYQIYSGGTMPVFTDGVLQTPEHANEELAQIIAKALDPDPEQRWQDPAQMGQAIVSYMQRNGTSNEVIVPQVVPEPVTQQPEAPQEQSESVEDILDGVDLETGPQITADDLPNQGPFAEDDSGNLSFMAGASNDELANILAGENPEADPILQQAEALTQVKVPDPVVVREPEQITAGESERSEQDSAPVAVDDLSDSRFTLEGLNLDTDEPEAEDEDEKDEEDDVIEYDEDDEREKPKRGWVKFLVLGLLALILIGAGLGFYLFYYLQPIDDMTISGSKDQLTVQIQTEVDETLLSVVCENIYGKSVTVPVINGQAHFSGLIADTQYHVQVIIEGFHQLTGETTATYFSPDESNILAIDLLTGDSSGTVVLTYEMEGPTAESWTVLYRAPGEEEKSMTFTGEQAIISGLTVGKQYTFTLQPDSELYLTGNNTAQYVASNVILAENLQIISLQEGQLVASWSIPEDEIVEGWHIHCFNSNGFSKTITTNNPTVTFSDLDHTQGYTVEVTAIGQSLSQSASVAENSITASNIEITAPQPGTLEIMWDSSELPDGGWTISYMMEGSEYVQELSVDENFATIITALPGQVYHFNILANNNAPVVHPDITFTTDDSKDFAREYAGYKVTRNNLSFGMCRTPNKDNWEYKDVPNKDYTRVYKPGEKASFVVFLNRVYGVSTEMIHTTFAFYDADGNLVDIEVSSRMWRDMWFKNYCELDIPDMPTAPGAYNVKIYFNGEYVTTQSFSIAEE